VSGDLPEAVPGLRDSLLAAPVRVARRMCLMYLSALRIGWPRGGWHALPEEMLPGGLMAALDDPSRAAEINRHAGIAGYAGFLRATVTSAGLIAALDDCDPRDAAAICCAWLDARAAGMPELADHLAGLREQAAFWADCATPEEAEAHLLALLPRVGRTGYGLGARKRLFAALWDTLPEADRRGFVARVDPEGVFRAAAS
jgi:hypothetical protein